MKYVLACASLALGSLALVPTAHADCATNLKPIESKVDKIADDATKNRVFFDVRRAHRELDEDDEVECQQAVDDASKALHLSP